MIYTYQQLVDTKYIQYVVYIYVVYTIYTMYGLIYSTIS